MPLKPEDRAAYQKAYRARQKGTPGIVSGHQPDFQHPPDPVPALTKRIEELEGEIIHLKRQLAGRTPIKPMGSFNSRPFTPSPKVKTHR